MTNTPIIGSKPKGMDMTADDGRAVFASATGQLAFHLGKHSKGLKKIKGITGFSEQQLTTATLQEGSKRMDGFIKTAIGNFMRTLQKDHCSLLDLFCLGFLIYADGLSKAMMSGFEVDDVFIHEQSKVFEGALRHVIDANKKRIALMGSDRSGVLATDKDKMH